MARKDWEPQYEYKENKHYKEFIKLKDNLKSFYPKKIFDVTKGKNYGTSEERIQHKKYLKELMNIILKPDGEFQQMVWETMSEQEKQKMEQRIKPRQGNGEYTL